MFSNLPVRLAALASALVLAAGGVALWVASGDTSADASTSRSAAATSPNPGTAPLVEPSDTLLAPPPAAPAKNREEQRFARADKDDDGRITQSEYLQQRRRNFDKLDVNRDGKLGFEEYAASGIAKFRGADSDGNGQLLPAEFATTAPKPKSRQTASVEPCRCPQTQSATLSDQNEPD